MTFKDTINENPYISLCVVFFVVFFIVLWASDGVVYHSPNAVLSERLFSTFGLPLSFGFGAIAIFAILMGENQDKITKEMKK